MNALKHSRVLTRRMQGVLFIMIVICGVVGMNCNRACAQLQRASGISASGSFFPPRTSTSGNNSTLRLVLDTAFEENVSPGTSYACLQTARETRFAFFCYVIHKYSDDTDSISYETRVRDERGDIKESFKLGNHDCPVVYSIIVNNQAKGAGDKETLNVAGVDLDLSAGRLLVIEPADSAVVVRQGAIPPFDFPKNGLRAESGEVVTEEVDELTARIVSVVGQSLREGTLKARIVSSAK
ncbi:MAG TPA: hypothetical protein VGG64_01275 [Pirellulales bacterium]